MAHSAHNRFVEIARFGRPHGLEGDLKIIPNDLFDVSLISDSTIIHYLNYRNDLVPARVLKLRVEEKANQQSFFVNLDVINSHNEAVSLAGRALLVDKNEIPDPIIPKSVDLTDFIVQYNDESIGRVTDLMKNPAHTIIEANTIYGLLLIPWVDEYVKTVHQNEKIIICKNLDQLIEN
ncbi:MAG: ribosome maturation factor RimM [Balneolaceae bacterium]